MMWPPKIVFAACALLLAAAGAQAAAGLCYVKTDGAPSAFDLIDVKRSGAVNADTWRAYYARKYLALEPARKTKTPLERYLKYASARFKGLDKDRSGTVTCSEYKASIEKLKARRMAKAALPPAPVAARTAPVKPRTR